MDEDETMCIGKVVVCCPVCKRTQQVTRPDSGHPFWSLEKPGDADDKVNFVEQALQCKNSDCGAKFNIYWYDK
jgi:uncharacterized protein YbaR (Trm112 family)